MRFREFNLTESDQTEINQDLDQLTNAALKNPAKSDKIKSGLLKILNFVKNRSKQPVQTKPNTQPTNSLVPTTQKTAISDPNDTIAEDLGTDIKAISSGIKSLLPNLSPKDLKILMAELEKQRREAFELGKEEAIRAYTQLDQYISEMLTRTGDQKNKKVIAQFRSIFQNDDISVEESIRFLQAVTKGNVIDMVALVNSPTGGKGEIIDDYVARDLKGTFEKVALEFFNFMPAKTGGSIGPGEIAFILLGSPTEKVTKGDLKIGDEKFEVKAGESGIGIDQETGKKKSIQSSAVLGGDQIPKPKAIWHKIKAILAKYKMPDIEFKSTRKGSEGKTVPNYKFGRDGFKAYNNAFEKLKMPIENRAFLLFEILEELYPSVVSKNSKTVISSITKILNKNNGLIPTDQNGIFMRYIALLALRTYRQDPGKENFLFFNKRSRTFRIFRGKDLETDILDPTSELRILKGIDWNDGQMAASPGLYIK